MSVVVSIVCGILAVIAGYLIGRDHGKRVMARRVRGEGELCWRCDGSGKERPPGSVLR